VLASAVAFGTLAIIAKLAYRSGIVPAQLLSLRFLFAVLVGAPVLAGVPGVAAGTLSILGRALSWTLVALFTGAFRVPVGGAQWAAVMAIAVVPTIFAISAFLAAMPRIGASRTALLSTVERVVTVVLAFALLGDRFGPGQVLGALLVLGSVVSLQLPQSRPFEGSPPAP